jgi:hypothetical protein
MPTNTATIRTGRLLEIRIDAGYRTADDVDRVFDAIEREVGKLPPATRTAAVADWRHCPVMSTEASARLLERLVRLSPRTERSSALVSTDSPTAVLQFARLIREAGHPDRRMFHDADELYEWLKEILTPAEAARLRLFLGQPSPP